MRLKVLFAKWWPLCLGLNVLTVNVITCPRTIPNLCEWKATWKHIWKNPSVIYIYIYIYIYLLICVLLCYVKILPKISKNKRHDLWILKMIAINVISYYMMMTIVMKRINFNGNLLKYQFVHTFGECVGVLCLDDYIDISVKISIV